MVWLAMLQLSSFMFFILFSEIHGDCFLNSEGLTLLKFREKVNFDPSGALANWNPDDCDPCAWSGIECLDGKVIMLNLSGHHLEGILAPELGNLTHLRYLDISKNYLSGTIPPHLGQLTTLEVLDLRDNNLTGPVPPELGGMHCLKRLLLCNNKFEGSIPMEIGRLSNLQFDYTASATAADICCINRKLGQSLKFGSEYSHDHSDTTRRTIAYIISEPDVGDSNKHTPHIRRVLLEQQSSNLAALPPNDTLAPNSSAPEVSRSSGSFPASPNPTKAAAPVSSPTPGQQNKPPDTNDQPSETNSRNSQALIIELSMAVLVIIVVAALLIIFCRSKTVKKIVPWKSGLSGQLQKAFVTGVPNLNREELEIACEEFSNIIYTQEGVAILYKGTLSSGVEIAVASTIINTASRWSKCAEKIYRKKIDILSRVNHKNFVNLIGFCEEDEPFTRIMVFEYAPNGTLYEHLHVKQVEQLDWGARMRILMGTAYCLQYMHDLNPPVPHVHLTSKALFLTDDYAAKIADIEFWKDIATDSKSEHTELPQPFDDVETNVHSFGIMMLEIISGRPPHSEEHGDILTWAETYLTDTSSITQLIDPGLESVKENELEVVCDAIRSCTQQDPSQRPSMDEVVKILRQALEISPHAATPQLSPLWWAELEILSAEAP